MIGVTGGTGFVGQRLVERLVNRFPVRVLALSMGQEAVPKVEYVMNDLTSREAVNGFVRGCTSIIHMAGIAHSSLRTAAERETSYGVNVEGTRTVLNAALRSGVRRFIFVSTAHVYDHHGLDLTEDATVGASSFYADTKIQAEALVSEAGKRGMESVIVRPCLIYGPGARFNLLSMMRGIDARYYFHLSGEAPQRSFLSVENASRAMSFLVSSATASGVYNLADKTPYSLVNFVNELADRMKRPRPLTMPSSLFQALCHAGSSIHKLGVNFPFTRETFAKLTSNFTLSIRRLAESGFEWDDDCGTPRQQMVDYYLASKQVSS
jgi:UDP-glucose 4-epimerase